MNSKIEVRIEAVKLAVNVEGVTDKNVIAVSEEIAKYIIGDISLPEAYDPTENQSNLLKIMSGMNQFNKKDEDIEGTTEKEE